MNHVRGHQDKRVRKDKLTLTERLNIKADHLIGSNAPVPKQMHINNTPFVFMSTTTSSQIISLKKSQKLRGKEATTYMINKYGWLTKTLNRIE